MNRNPSIGSKGGFDLPNKQNHDGIESAIAFVTNQPDILSGSSPYYFSPLKTNCLKDQQGGIHIMMEKTDLPESHNEDR